MLNLFIYQINIMDAYLESLLSDNKLPIFMKLLPGVCNLHQVRERLLCRLLKSLYSLKQSRKFWKQDVIAFYKNIKFIQLNNDSNILIQYVENKISIVSIYIDNFLLTSNIIATLKALKVSFSKEYNIKDLDKVKTIIG